MSVTWGNSAEHTAAFRRALAEFYLENPEEHRRFEELDLDLQRLILGRQLEIYRELERCPERVA